MKSTIMSVATVAVTKSVKPSVPFLPKKKTPTVARENPDGLMRLHKFLYIFNLRQGAILIAVQHIALSACTLILLLVGISHAQEMMQVLNSDMEDNAEREGTYLIDDEDMTLFRESPGEATNNQQKFKIAQNLAMMVVIFLYGSLVTTAIYLMFSMALFYGAAKNKQEYIIPWAFLSSFAIIIMSGGLFLGDRSALLIKLCGGRASYRCVSTFLLIAHIYCIATVASFIYELRLVQKKICLSEEIKPRKTANGTVTIRFNPVVTEAHLV